MRNAATVRAPSATSRPTSGGDQSTQPLTPAETAAEEEVVGGPTPEAAGDSVAKHRVFRVIGNRAVMVPLACIAALLVGFGSVTAVLRIGDEPAQSDVKTPTTTAAGAPAPPSIAPPVDSPRAPAPSAPAVQSEPPAAEQPPIPQPAPAQPTPRPETDAPAPPSSAPPTTTPQTTTPTTTTPSG
jgi:hypothetical protein